MVAQDTDAAALADAVINAAGSPVASTNPEDYAIDGVSPSVAVRPANVEAVSAVMLEAHRAGAAVTPWGGGTRIALGNLPRRYDVALDMTGLDQIIAHNHGDLTATVQTGVTVAALRRALAEHGQFLPIDPPLPETATVGGTLAVGNSGPLKWQYGSVRDTVIGMKVVHADGVVTKSGGQVVKNVSGYDMARLHIGGLGTLAVIVEVSVKLTPLPHHETTVVASYDTAANAIRAALDIFEGDAVPLALMVIGPGPAASFGDLDAGACHLAVRLGGRTRTVDRMVTEATAVARRQGAREVCELEGHAASSLWRRAADFGWDEATRPTVGVRASATPASVGRLWEAFQHQETAPAGRAALVCHPAHGVVQACWYHGGAQLGVEAVRALIQTVREAVSSEGGNMVVETCPPSAKAGLDVWDDVGDQITVMRALKDQYDPERILSPGRYVGGI